MLSLHPTVALLCCILVQQNYCIGIEGHTYKEYSTKKSDWCDYITEHRQKLFEMFFNMGQIDLMVFKLFARKMSEVTVGTRKIHGKEALVEFYKKQRSENGVNEIEIFPGRAEEIFRDRIGNWTRSPTIYIPQAIANWGKFRWIYKNGTQSELMDYEQIWIREEDGMYRILSDMSVLKNN